MILSLLFRYILIGVLITCIAELRGNWVMYTVHRNRYNYKELTKEDFPYGLGVSFL